MLVIHPDKIRWLFWLRWKLFLRGFTRDKSRIISTIFMVVFGLPLLGGIALATFFAYRFLPVPVNAEILFLVLTATYLLWMALPLLEFTVNEGLDVSKLLLFPLTRSELMVSLLFSTLLDIPMFGLILVFIAVVAGWAISLPVALLTLVAVLIFYVQVVGISQLVLALLMSTLQSRRFRDLSIILIALFSMSCYLIQQLLLRGLGTRDFVTNIEQARFSFYLQWTPPGMSASAIQQASLGNWGTSFIWLGASLIVAVLVLYLWARVLERSLSTPEVGGAVRARQRKAPRKVAVGAANVARPPVASGAILERVGFTQVFAIAVKDWKYFWRDPQLKTTLLSSLYIVIIFLAGPFLNPGGSFNSLGLLSFSAPLAVFFSVFTLSYNTLGMERQSLTTLFLFPVEPRRILLGKNLAVAVIGIVELFLLSLAGVVLSHSWQFVLPVLAMGLAGIGVVIGCGNVSSVFLPQRMRQMQRGFQATGSSSGNAGCIRGLMSLLVLGVTLVVLSPVIVSLFLPLYFHIQWIWVFSIPAALLYGIVFHQLVTWLVAPRMLAREPEILEVTTRE
jgi:ABC-2 type transport system permease protein